MHCKEGAKEAERVGGRGNASEPYAVLTKSLYGLKQASRQGHAHNYVPEDFGFLAEPGGGMRFSVGV